MPSMRNLINLINEQASDARPSRESYVVERPLISMDYTKWLVDYLNNGGKITYVYNYPSSQMLKGTFFKNLKSHKRIRIKLPALYGSSLTTYILDRGIMPEPLDPNEGFGGYGHNNIFYYDRMTKKPRTTSVINLYLDIIDDLETLGFELKEHHFMRNTDYQKYLDPGSDYDDDDDDPAFRD